MDASTKTSPALKRPKGRKTPLGREAWLNAAKTALIREGVGNVEVGKLARKLRATRGGFYWFFPSRKELLDTLLADWEKTNTAAWKAVVGDGSAGGMSEFKALNEMWVGEKGYDPQWDASVREWARTSPRAATAMRRVDDVRIDIIRRIFLHMGYEATEAFVRARTAYFHQVGYYTIGVRESREQRLKLMPFYIRILSGHDI
jgi:AcrR family transcriptional regulator